MREIQFIFIEKAMQRLQRSNVYVLRQVFLAATRFHRVLLSSHGSKLKYNNSDSDHGRESNTDSSTD